MARIIILSLLVMACTVVESRAQEEERASIAIEAEIISGLGTSSSGVLSTSSGSAGVAAVPEAATAEGTVEDGVATSVAPAPPSPTVEDVASQLVQSAEQGLLTTADTAMVAALAAGTRSNRQNLDALVTVTVVDETGNIRSSSMPVGDITADMFGPALRQEAVETGAVGPFDVSILSGDVMRRSLGTTYFYVQICSCSI